MTDKPYGLFRQPKNTMPQIGSIWAVLSVDEADGNEGVCSIRVGDSWMPLIAADEKRLAIIRREGAALARVTGKKLRLVKFTAREEVWAWDGAAAASGGG